MKKKTRVIMLILTVISNVTFILSGMLMTFWIINIMNAAMEFLSNPVTLILMMVLFTLSFIASPLNIALYVKMLRSDKRARESAAESVQTEPKKSAKV